MRLVGLFLFILGIYTIFINSWNSHAFGLQHAGIEAIVERGTIWLEGGSQPEFVPSDDSFIFNKHSHAMKQPGQFFLGSIPYFFLNLLDIRFINHYDYASHLITFFTSTVMMGGMGVLIYLLLEDCDFPLKVKYMTTFGVMFGTLLLPYAGLPHHDIYATFFMFAGASLLIRYLIKKDYSDIFLWTGGFFVGFSSFFSMLPVAAIVGLTILGIFSLKTWRERLIFVSAVGFGTTPAFWYNYLVFSRVFAFPNIAGSVFDTYPKITPDLWSKLKHYLLSPTTSVFAFSPFLLLSVIGWLTKTGRKRYGVGIILVCSLYVLHVSSIESYGGFQYGPRYLIPILPMLGMGIAFLLAKMRYAVIYIAAILYSVVVAMVGALTTVMYPQPGPYAPIVQFRRIISGDLPEFRMLPIGVVIAVGAMLILKHANRQLSRP